MELKTGTLVKGKHRRRFPIQKLLCKKLHQNTENFYCLQKFNTWLAKYIAKRGDSDSTLLQEEDLASKNIMSKRHCIKNGHGKEENWKRRFCIKTLALKYCKNTGWKKGTMLESMGRWLGCENLLARRPKFEPSAQGKPCPLVLESPPEKQRPNRGTRDKARFDMSPFDMSKLNILWMFDALSAL